MSGGGQALYRAVWRWHFWAGLLVLPFLAWLAATGTLYLYKGAVERIAYGDWLTVDAAASRLPVAAMTARVERATGAQVTQVAAPALPADSWRMTLVEPEGGRRTAFVDPHDGAVKGVTGAGGVVATIRSLHSLAITGTIGNALIEIVGGWTIILVATGFYLWWPRRGAKAVALRGSPGKRLFWRDLHASTGMIAGAVVLFLAVTGMPWSVLWGKSLQGALASNHIGRPAAPGGGGGHNGHGASAERAGSVGHEGAATLPWSMRGGDMPMGGMRRITPDAALAAAQARGLAAPYTLTLPTKAGAPYLISAAAVRAQDAHVVYVDAATGAVLQDARYAAFGVGARVTEWGSAVHMGQQYGEPNRLVMLTGCIAILLLCISAPVMWWKRRPAGRIGAPPGGSGAGLVAIMAVAGVIFPLTGATMVMAWVVERLVGMSAACKRRAQAQLGA